MKNWKEICKKILYPPAWGIVILVIISVVSLVLIFTKGWASIAYVIAFYALTIVCIACAEVFPEWYRKIRQKIYDNQYGNRYMTDAAFKTYVSLYRSLAINLLIPFWQ